MTISYLETMRVAVDVKVLYGNLGIVAHQLSTIRAGGGERAAGGRHTEKRYLGGKTLKHFHTSSIRMLGILHMFVISSV